MLVVHHNEIVPADASLFGITRELLDVLETVIGNKGLIVGTSDSGVFIEEIEKVLGVEVMQGVFSGRPDAPSTIPGEEGVPPQDIGFFRFATLIEGIIRFLFPAGGITSDPWGAQLAELSVCSRTFQWANCIGTNDYNRLYQQWEYDFLANVDPNINYWQEPGYFIDFSSGLGGALYRDLFSGQHITVFREAGTLKDFFVGFSSYFVQTTQFQQARAIANDYEQNQIDSLFVGHSLGGGLASFAALETNAEAVIFNSLGLRIKSEYDESGVTNYYSIWDVLTFLQKYLPGVPSAAGNQIPVRNGGIHEIFPLCDALGGDECEDPNP